jgi:hypothetical protein
VPQPIFDGGELKPRTRHACCSCGQLRVSCSGEPVRISICHCLDCQRRTGSAFGYQARFPKDQVAVEGEFTTYERRGDSGQTVTLRFCPRCGSTLFWTLAAQPELIAVAAGGFADPAFPPPRFSVYERRRHSWVNLPSPDTLERTD